MSTGIGHRYDMRYPQDHQSGPNEDTDHVDRMDGSNATNLLLNKSRDAYKGAVVGSAPIQHRRG